jgi:hypothetical protein
MKQSFMFDIKVRLTPYKNKVGMKQSFMFDIKVRLTAVQR